MRLIDLLLRLYPRKYRERYGREMEAFFLQEREAGEGGAGYWARLFTDHVRASVAVRRGKGDGMFRKGWEELTGGLRSLRRSPSFALFAVFTLALGIGATTAVFSVLDRVVLRPLPYPGSERMVLVGIDPRHDPGSLGPLSDPLTARLQGDGGPAEAVVAASTAGVVFQDGGDPERMEMERVTRGFFGFFGASPAAGRLLDDADYHAGAPKVAVLGHGFWADRYGSDPGVVGRSIRLDEEVFIVVGVLGRHFVPPPEIVGSRDVWIAQPVSLGGYKGSFYLSGVARLRPGATAGDLDAYVDRVVEEIHDGGGPNFLVGGAVASYRDTVVGPVRSTLDRMMAAVMILLLIACVNVSSLLLTRGTQRRRELAVRSALGAGRGRLVRQLLGESAILAAAAGVLGSALAWGAVELFRRHAPPGLPRLEEVAVDVRGLVFSLLVAVATVLIFGLLPALRSTGERGTGASALTRRATPGRPEGRLRATLIGLETALAVVLAVGSALLAHDLARLSREDPGFRPEGLVAMRLNLEPRFQREEWAGVWERLLEGARGLPGVVGASIATQAPYTGSRVASTFRPEGSENGDGEILVTVMVAGDYLESLGTNLDQGRAFTDADDGSVPVALVNEAFVHRYWPGEDGVGRHVQSGGEGVDDEPNYEVVGVVGDVRTNAGREPPPQILLPLRESPWRDMEVLVRFEGDVAPLVAALRAMVRRLDPGLPVTRIATVESLASESLSRPRFYTTLFGGFAVVALILALVGVYGTTSFATRTRVREIGIRLALGARRRRVVGRTVARTGGVIAAGVGLGLAAAFVGARGMVDVLVYVTPRDWAAYLSVAVLVMSAGILAAWVPAGRAGRVDPANTLREE